MGVSSLQHIECYSKGARPDLPGPCFHPKAAPIREKTFSSGKKVKFTTACLEKFKVFKISHSPVT